MGNLNVVMINVTSRDDGLRVLDRLDTGAEPARSTSRMWRWFIGTIRGR